MKHYLIIYYYFNVVVLKSSSLSYNIVVVPIKSLVLNKIPEELTLDTRGDLGLRSVLNISNRFRFDYFVT